MAFDAQARICKRANLRSREPLIHGAHEHDV